MTSRLHANFDTGTVASLQSQIRYSPRYSKFLQSFRSVGAQYASWNEYSGFLAAKHGARDGERLKSLFLIEGLPIFLSHIQSWVRAVLSKTAYIGPSRATGQRYYRAQELSIEAINPSGSNLAVFLSSLTREEQENFAAWSEEIIGYRVRPLQIPGHISLQLTETGSEHQFNLADVGFGFSQLLPIMAQIWAVSNVGNYETDHEILAIEQPELHLHPAYQSKIADGLVEGIAQYPTDASTSNPLNSYRDP